ncbi:hypothetical protein CTRI78_v011129 [Colletotrichum trifolii]|uniref:Uncharacterized protein n=1 Tax=Colletotrichum trifolii TaxID=5466 RepID=A0A4R8QNY8_COLTR|nr:hypothetical protein CTRI78_v011129 [Colletotrichum trifolii]
MLNTQAIRPTNAAEDRIPTIMQEKATKLVEAKLARVAAVTPPVVDAGAIPISFPYYDESFLTGCWSFGDIVTRCSIHGEVAEYDVVSGFTE